MRYLGAILAILLLAGGVYGQEEEAKPELPEKQEGASSEPSLKEITEQMKRLGSRFLSDRVKARKWIVKTREAAVPSLKQALESGNHLLRMGALGALVRMKRSEAVLYVLRMRKDPILSVRWFACRVCVNGGPEMLMEIERLRETGQLTEDDLPESELAKIRRDVVTGIFGKIDYLTHYSGQYAEVVSLGPSIVPTLFQLLERELDVRGSTGLRGGGSALIRALSDMRNERAAERLKALYKDPRASSFRTEIVTSLAILGYDEPLKKELDNALEAVEKLSNKNTLFQVGLLYHRAGHYDKSTEWFRKAAEAADKEPGQTGFYYCNLACALSMNKKLDEAVEALKKGLERGSFRPEWLIEDKELDPIRKHPKFIELMKKYCPESLQEKPSARQQGRE